MENYTEEIEPVNPLTDDSYSELSDRAKKLLSECYKATLVSPLELCRLKKEGCRSAQILSALNEVERYLINEE